MKAAEDYIRPVTHKGTVTIPVEIRRLLGVRASGKVKFRVAGGRVELLPPPMTLEAAFGSVTPLQRPEAFKKVRAAALDEHIRKSALKAKG